MCKKKLANFAPNPLRRAEPTADFAAGIARNAISDGYNATRNSSPSETLTNRSLGFEGYYSNKFAGIILRTSKNDTIVV